jgi:predicted NUDIX family NTP pyrophosphohydrolase
MAKQSAGLLLYRIRSGIIEVLLVHPGGPYWLKKDHEAWSIPKGEFNPEEIPLEAALRETNEELGVVIQGDFTPLTPVRQKSGKVIHAWAVKGDFDVSLLKSNTFEMEWPPKSGEMKSFPEIDKAEWFDLAQAKEKINPGQMPLLDELGTMANK